METLHRDLIIIFSSASARETWFHGDTAIRDHRQECQNRPGVRAATLGGCGTNLESEGNRFPVKDTGTVRHGTRIRYLNRIPSRKKKR